MQSRFPYRQVLITFVVVVLGYVLVYQWIEHTRHRKGAWEVTFRASTNGEPELIVNQPGLGIDNVTIRVLGEQVAGTNLPMTVAFDFPGRTAPLGEVIYEDLTFLPGVVTFNLFGHGVELLPRALLVNRREILWESGMTVPLSPDQKPARPPRSPGAAKEPSGP